jgi:hypothetical protein
MTRVQVHKNTTIAIDREVGEVCWEHKNGWNELHHISEDWISKYLLCRICSKPLNDEAFASALWRGEKKVCSICEQKEPK